MAVEASMEQQKGKQGFVLKDGATEGDYLWMIDAWMGQRGRGSNASVIFFLADKERLQPFCVFQVPYDL